MTKEEIIELVKQTDLLGIIDSQYYENELWISDVVEFAKLVAEKEREECAKIAENRILHDKNKNIKKGYLFAQQSIAQDIRTRIQK